MKLWYWPKGAKEGVELRQGTEISFRDGHVWVDGKQLSEEEAAPYWRCISPFTPEDTVGDAETQTHRIVTYE